MTPREPGRPGRSRHLVSLLPLLLAAPLAAQLLPVPTCQIDATGKEIRVVVTYATPATHVLLAAPNGHVVQIGGIEILASATVVGVVPMVATAGFTLPFPAHLAAKYGVHFQAVILDGDRIVGGPVAAAATTFDPTPFGPVYPKGRIAEAAMYTIGFARSSIYPLFVAEFDATSDGYALYAAAVVRQPDTTDVYLTLKTPGPGEGMLDIAQYLRVDIPLGFTAGQRVRVFALEGPRPFGTALAYYVPCMQFEAKVPLPK